MKNARMCWKSSLTTGRAVALAAVCMGVAFRPELKATTNNCAQFNGSGSYIYVASSALLKLTAPMTMEVWVKPAAGGGEWALILGKQYNPSDSNPWYSYRFFAASANSGEKGFPRRVNFTVTPASGGETGSTSTTVVPVGAWTHIAGVYDGTNLTVYINGSPEASLPMTTSLRNSDLGLYIGKAPWTGYNNYNGQMDEIRLWNVARTQNQIQGSMHHTLSGNEAGLVAYWPFDDAPGSATAADASHHNHVGTLYSGAAIVANSTAPVYQTFTCVFQTDGTEGATVNGTASSTQIVNDGAACTAVTAAAAVGYEFAGWTGSYVGMENPLTVTNVTADLNVVAHFATLRAAQGTPQWWLAKYNLTAGGLTFDQAEQGDTDNDTFKAWQEYIADTNPTNAMSRFRIVGIEAGPPVKVTYDPGSTGRVYTLQRLADLAEGRWTNVPNQGPRAGAGGVDTMVDTNAIAARFYRVLVQMP